LSALKNIKDFVSKMFSSNTFTLLLCLLSSVQGFPKQDDNYAYYNEQEYKDEYDYGDDVSHVDDEDGTHDDSILIHRPVIVSESVQLDVDNGMTIRLPCNVDKLPGEISIIWSKEDAKKTIIAMGTLVLDQEYKKRATVMVDDKGSTLTIGIAKSEDAGQYKCSVAVKGNRPEIKHTVRIRAPPSIESSIPTVLDVTIGDDVTLNCKGSGSPIPKVKWSRVGKMMPDGSSEIESDVVILSKVTRKHAGTYRCSASNGQGNGVSKEVQVVVQYTPEVDITEMFVHTKSGDEAEIVCEVHAAPMATVVWSKNGQKLSSSQRVKIDHSGSRHTLTINQVQKEDFSTYTCKATNSFGSDQKMIEVSGNAAPAVFKSVAAGYSENTFLLEWTSMSYTPIQEFNLEISLSSSGSWKSYTVTPTQDGAYHFAGKQFLSDLQSATTYKARVNAKNGDGWSSPSPVWNFATKGALPSPARVTASASSTSSTSIILLLCISSLLLRKQY